jgi:hypothetical protein
MSADCVETYPTRTQPMLARVQEATPFLPWERWNARGWWSLVAGLPSLVAFMLVLALGTVLLVAPLRLRHVREATEARLKESERARDYESVRVDCERLLRDDSTNEAASYSLAMAFRGLDESDAASQLLNQLAPLESSKHVGFVPAHLLLAQELLVTSPNSERRSLAERHLLRVV